MSTITMRLDAVTDTIVPVCTVLHVTEQAGNGKPIVIGKSVWFEKSDAVEYAKDQSIAWTNPNRFPVYDHQDKLVCSFVAGKEIAPFQIM